MPEENCDEDYMKKNKENQIYLQLDNSIGEFGQSQKTRRREAVSGGKTPRPVKRQ